jgi:hypothetical protein
MAAANPLMPIAVPRVTLFKSRPIDDVAARLRDVLAGAPVFPIPPTDRAKRRRHARGLPTCLGHS